MEMTIFIDATTKLNWQPTYISRDTLIMTDIEFFTENGGGVKVKAMVVFNASLFKS